MSPVPPRLAIPCPKSFTTTVPPVESRYFLSWVPEP